MLLFIQVEAVDNQTNGVDVTVLIIRIIILLHVTGKQLKDKHDEASRY